MVPQHGPFSLHTMLEGPWLPKTAFPTPMVRPLDGSQGSSPLQGHNSWLVCEVALRSWKPLDTLNGKPKTFTIQALSLMEKRRRLSKLASHYTWGTNGVSMWLQDGCKVYMDQPMRALRLQWSHAFSLVCEVALNNRLLEGSLTQIWETLNAHNCCFIIFYHVWGPA